MQSWCWNIPEELWCGCFQPRFLPTSFVDSLALQNVFSSSAPNISAFIPFCFVRLRSANLFVLSHRFDDPVGQYALRSRPTKSSGPFLRLDCGFVVSCRVASDVGWSGARPLVCLCRLPSRNIFRRKHVAQSFEEALCSRVQFYR